MLTGKAGLSWAIRSSMLVVLLSTALCTSKEPSSDHYPSDLQQLHKNTIAYILADSANDQEVQEALQALSSEGTWPDIDYTSQERGAWPPRNHLSRILLMAKSYRTEDSQYYTDAEVGQKIHLALNYWLENDFICPNWWYPVIGVPKVLNPIMLLMEDEISEDQLTKALVILDRCKIGRTGQNKVWQSGNVLLKSLLLQHTDTIMMAAKSIQEELRVSEGEGVQPDWSYHQHGPQLQFGNYGLSYISDMIQWITILRNTPFSFDESKVSVLRNYLLEGQQWITWKNQMDISSCGRQLFVDSPETKATSLSTSMKKMTVLDPEYSEAYAQANNFLSLSGNKHFWRSDVQVHRNNDYYFSVKMCSERVIGAESCNSENLQGYYMGDGATFLYQTGEEYRNIFPFLDWKKIPGTTTQQDDDPLPVLTASGYRIESDFVGGVSNGQQGMAVLDYNRNGLTARKAWFMLDDMIICLGNSITSKRGREVTTGVNQVYLNGPVKIAKSNAISEAKESQVLNDPAWILHDGLGYIFPKGGKLALNTGKVEGSWHWVASRYPDERIEDRIFKLWLDHGINPIDQSYEYLLLPNADQSKIEEVYKSKRFELTNSKHIQQVVSKDGSLAGISFYKAGRSNVLGGIAVSDPCLLLLKNAEGKLEVSVSDPTQKLGQVEVAINGNYRGDQVEVRNSKSFVTIDLPKGAQAGNTVQVTLLK